MLSFHCLNDVHSKLLVMKEISTLMLQYTKEMCFKFAKLVTSFDGIIKLEYYFFLTPNKARKFKIYKDMEVCPNSDLN